LTTDDTDHSEKKEESMFQKLINAVQNLRRRNTALGPAPATKEQRAAMDNIDRNASPQASRERAAEIVDDLRMQSGPEQGGQG
jgi:hypothetical protein